MVEWNIKKELKMKNETDVNYVIQYIEDKIKPYSLNEIGKIIFQFYLLKLM